MGQGRDQHRGLVLGEVPGASAEIGVAGGLDTPQVRAELRDVQIQRHDPVFAQRPLEPVGDDRLLSLRSGLREGDR